MVAILAWLLIPHVFWGVAGWRWLSLLPAIGAVLVWLVRRTLPESPRWLAAHGQATEADEVLTRMESRVESDLGRPLESPQARVRIRLEIAAATPRPRLWDGRYRRTTAVLVVFHLFQTIGYYGFSNWLPTLLVAQGVTISKSLGYTAVLTLVAPTAPLVFMLSADQFQRKWLVVAGALLASVAGLLLSTTTRDTTFLGYALFGGGTATGLSLMSFAYHDYQNEVFPTEIRARGVGFAYSFSHAPPPRLRGMAACS